MKSLTRRFALKCAAFASAWLGVRPRSLQALTQSAAQGRPEDNEDATIVSWANTHDRVWLGANLWANPMEDWRVIDGAAECQSMAGNRNIHLLTHQITDGTGDLRMWVKVRQVESQATDGGVGFRIGVRSDIDEYRSNCFARGGIDIGYIDGQLKLGPKQVDVEIDPKEEHTFTVTGEPDGNIYRLQLDVADASGEQLGSVNHTVPVDRIKGNVALVNNFANRQGGQVGSRYRFSQWQVAGNAFQITPKHQFGPILWSMYTLSDSRSDEGFVLKSTMLTGPLGEEDNHHCELFIERDGQWQSVGEATLDTDAWTATVRVAKWDETQSASYKWVYRQRHRDGSETEATYTGTIRANPSGRPLRIGALTCQNDYAFPYQPVAENLLKLDPDMLYFSGDQLYEGHGGYGVIREPADMAILNYLRKYYQFGWSFGEAMRDRPTVCIPDDHDVFQGNIWGEAGKPMDRKNAGTSSLGGYRNPARMVNVVHKTNVSHHPEPYDATPVKQDISVYYGDMVYGGVGFAILSDRQFKSGPEKVESDSDRNDHVRSPDFDTEKLDKPGLVLLGERQEAFLENWAEDWRGHSMKIVLSQTVFAGVATHHGQYDGYLKADLDSGSWPQTPRNRAIRIMRKSKALHINGDQHLASLTQYGVDRQRDSNWSFCTPAIAVGYPRWWRPDELSMPHENRPEHGLPNTGEYIDGLGNKVYVYAVGNPEVASKPHRYERAHQKGSGFGLVTVDLEAKTYHLEAFKFLVDATEDNPDHQFPGWPLTVHQQENLGDNLIQ